MLIKPLLIRQWKTVRNVKWPGWMESSLCHEVDNLCLLRSASTYSALINCTSLLPSLFLKATIAQGIKCFTNQLVFYSYVRINDKVLCPNDISLHEVITVSGLWWTLLNRLVEIKRHHCKGTARIEVVSKAARLWLLYSSSNPDQLASRSRILGARFS